MCGPGVQKRVYGSVFLLLYHRKVKVVDMTEQSSVPKAVSVFKLVGAGVVRLMCMHDLKTTKLIMIIFGSHLLYRHVLQGQIGFSQKKN